MSIKFYEIAFGIKADGATEDANRGLCDSEYSIAIKATHYPTFEEAEKFVSDDLKQLGYDGVYSITPLTEEELHSFFDTDNIDDWKILERQDKNAMDKNRVAELYNDSEIDMLNYINQFIDCSELIDLNDKYVYGKSTGEEADKYHSGVKALLTQIGIHFNDLDEAIKE